MNLDRLNIGLFNYSKHFYNIGDYIQTLAVVNQLAPYYKNNWEMTEQMQSIFSLYQEDCESTQLNLEGANNVSVRPVLRDCLSLESDKPKTWVVMNGWYMHKMFSSKLGVFDFPPPASIRPIFLSFHVNRIDMMQDQRVVDYLNRYGPVGCRDWSTVYLLRSVGVDAFFSGCLTLTLDLPKSKIREVNPKRVYFVDTVKGMHSYNEDPDKYSTKYVTQRDLEYLSQSFEVNMNDAIDLLSRYSSAHKVVTSRLHCYMPCMALKISTEFLPRDVNDRRFFGLFPLEEQAKQELRASLIKSIRSAFNNLFTYGDESKFYEYWRDVNSHSITQNS